MTKTQKEKNKERQKDRTTLSWGLIGKYERMSRHFLLIEDPNSSSCLIFPFSGIHKVDTYIVCVFCWSSLLLVNASVQNLVWGNRIICRWLWAVKKFGQCHNYLKLTNNLSNILLNRYTSSCLIDPRCNMGKFSVIWICWIFYWILFPSSVQSDPGKNKWTDHVIKLWCLMPSIIIYKRWWWQRKWNLCSW